MADVDDWSRWLDRHGGTLLLLARQWTSSPADAADVVQDAFLRFWRSRRGVADPMSYLYACLKGCALDLHRGNKRRRARERVAARAETAGGWPGGQPEPDERFAEIAAALDDLPPEQREVLTMKTWGRLTFDQIAAALAISPNTAASRYRYGLEKLRGRLCAAEGVPRESVP